MRERPVPCLNASFDEVRLGRHTTFNDNRECDRCTGRWTDPQVAIDLDERRATAMALHPSSFGEAS